jgi:chromosomal replication initiator protein
MHMQIEIEAIQIAVAERFSLLREELLGQSSKRTIVLPRQIAMYITKRLTHASLPEIGRRFGGKHHTTVMHSIAKVCELKRVDSALDRCVRTLLKELERAPCRLLGVQARGVTEGRRAAAVQDRSR